MRRHAIVAALVSLVLVPVPAVVAAVSPTDEAASAQPGALPENDRAKGLVFDGLRRSASSDECAGGFEIEVDHTTVCTHGPDAAPLDDDVRSPRSVAQLRLDTLALKAAPAARDATVVHGNEQQHDHPADAASADTTGTAAASDAVPVIGDGVSGNRVQAIYAVAADRTDRFGEVAPLIATWAAHVDDMVDQSAALTGGDRHVRYVTGANGALDIKRVILPVVGDDTFNDTISAVRAAGYTDPTRKYLIWTDANVYCGIGTIYGDDRSTQDNANNGRYAMYSRVDTGCWGRTNSTELHEIVHNMGGVQLSAPNVTPNWHCSDDYDRMCYPDSSSVVMSYDCPASMEALLDCGNDDYFHTSPPPGSYLDTNWNVANSSFLHAGVVDDPPPPPTNSAPVVTVSAPASVTLGTSAALDAMVIDDGIPGPYSVAWSQSTGPGTASFDDASAAATSVAFSLEGSYMLTITASDGELTSSASVTISVNPSVPTNEAPVIVVSGPSSIVLGDGAALDATVTDDGLPGPHSISWSQSSGPGQVTFANPLTEDTIATFSGPGTYSVTATVDDGELTDSATISITVEDEAPAGPIEVTEIFSGSLNKKWPDRSYDTVVASGSTTATLSFSSKGGGRKAASSELTLTARDANGDVVATTIGPSVLQLSLELPAGIYRWEVSGASTSFTLEVTHMK